jgi:hypothetical protein
MGGLFSKKKKENKVSQHDKAVLDLKVQRDKLKQYQKKVCPCLFAALAFFFLRDFNTKITVRTSCNKGDGDRAQFVERKKEKTGVVGIEEEEISRATTFKNGSAAIQPSRDGILQVENGRFLNIFITDRFHRVCSTGTESFPRLKGRKCRFERNSKSNVDRRN